MGIVFSVYGIFSTISSTFMGKVLIKLGRKNVLIWTAVIMILGNLMISLLTYVHDPTIFVALLMIARIGLGFCTGAALTSRKSIMFRNGYLS